MEWKNIGLKRYIHSDIDNFTSNVGMNIRKTFNSDWRKILNSFIKRNVIVEGYPNLDPNKQYIFACNHSFDEDVISLLSVIDRNAYSLTGSTDQLIHNPMFYAVWLNGMIYVDRLDDKSRKESLNKMKRVLEFGNSIMIFPEGGYNNTENQLICPLFSGVYSLSKETGLEVVPIISYNDFGSNDIYIKASDPIELYNYEKYEGLTFLRDNMATSVFDMINNHAKMVKREDLPANSREYYMDVRKQIYAIQKWYNESWPEDEITYYKGHGIVEEKDVYKNIKNVKITPQNAHILLPLLSRLKEEESYNLQDYCRKKIPLRGKKI